MAKYVSGDKVIVKIQDHDYLATVITSETNAEGEEVYLTSVLGVGQCYSFKESEMIEIN